MRDEQEYRQGLAMSGIPLHMHDGYIRYLMEGIKPGHFLMAVLSNDLREACARGDLENQRALYQHVYFLFNYCPGHCWGSPESVNEWISIHQAQREAKIPDV
jgi:hypothetical protein